MFMLVVSSFLQMGYKKLKTEMISRALTKFIKTAFKMFEAIWRIEAIQMVIWLCFRCLRG